MKLVQRDNKQLRVADDQVENMRQFGYVEVDGKTGKPIKVPTAETEADRLKKENAALKRENKDLNAQVKELDTKMKELSTQLEGAQPHPEG